MTELGASRYLATPSYQLDRGIFENFLGEHARALGVRLHRRRVGARHRRWREDAAPRIALRWSRRRRARARGRRPLARRCLAAAPACSSASSISREANDHDANAVWFRIDARIDIDEWSRTIRMARALRSAAIAGSRPITCAARATGPG